MKKILIVANWKMNPNTLEEAKNLFGLIKKGFGPATGGSTPRKSGGRTPLSKNLEIVICPPFIYLSLLGLKPYTLNPKLGAQNCSWEQKGAYTGEISPKMLKNLGVEYVIIGHSERRKYFKETNGIIEKKLRAVIKLGLKPILCIDKISQIPKDIENWKLKIENLIIAYEPLFAIGTGKACSWQKAKEMRIKIRLLASEANRILYGGSVNSQNAKDYIKQAGFDGLLVGGASLDAKEFIKIIKNISV